MPLPLMAVAALVITPAISMAISTALSAPITQGYNRIAPILVPGPDILVRLRMRNQMPEDQFLAFMRRHGFSTEQATNVLSAALFQPAAGDLVNWQSKEVFEADSVEKYGLDAEFEGLDLALFAKAGITEEQARNFWRAHWQHPPFNQIAEMMHRDILADIDGPSKVEPGSDSWEALRLESQAELFDWYRLVEIPPHWRDKLTKLSERQVTRVDARRMFDMRTIDERRLLRMNLNRGLSLEDAQAMVLWTKVDGAFNDLVRMFQNGWINQEDVLQRLVDTGMPEDRAIELFKTKIDNLARPLRTANERDLTKSEIVKGVKNEIITREFGVGMLVEMGFDKPEAEFIMDINIEAGESPTDELEFTWLVQSWRNANNLSAHPVPREVIQLSRAHKQAHGLLQQALDTDAPDTEIATLKMEVSRTKDAFHISLNDAGLLEQFGEKF